MPILKNAQLAIIEQAKFTGYLLDPDHEDGRHKARVFKAALGFDRGNHADLIKAIRTGIMMFEAEYVGDTVHGVLWRVDMPVTGPRGTAVVRIGWIYEKDKDVPRLTSAYVLRKR